MKLQISSVSLTWFLSIMSGVPWCAWWLLQFTINLITRLWRIDCFTTENEHSCLTQVHNWQISDISKRFQMISVSFPHFLVLSFQRPDQFSPGQSQQPTWVLLAHCAHCAPSLGLRQQTLYLQHGSLDTAFILEMPGWPWCSSSSLQPCGYQHTHSPHCHHF